jgi:hypothetical protein
LTRDDANDLFYTGGKHRSAFLKSLGSGAVPAAAISRLLECAGPAGTAAWKDILRSAFEFAGEWRMKDKPEGLQERLAALVALTTAPAALQLLACMLLEEVVDANRRMAEEVPARGGRRGPEWGRQWEGGSVFGPLLRVNAVVDAGAAMREIVSHGELKGMFPELLTGVRGYPKSRCGLVEALSCLQLHAVVHHWLQSSC